MGNSIDKMYKINPGHLSRINKFKDLVGKETFDQILQGMGAIDIPLEEDKYCELMNICLDDESVPFAEIPYGDAEEIISFFCRPFAGRSLRQAKSTIAGISSLLQGLDPKVLRMATESLQSRSANGTSTGQSNSQTETSKKENGSIQD
jgi:hypothetical protein